MKRKWLVGLLLLAVVGSGVWWWTRRASPELIAAANDRGIGHLERNEKPEAVVAFREVVRLDPKSIPGRINLAIALFNSQKKDATADELEDSRKLFTDVLNQEPDNPYAHTGLGLIDYFLGRAKEAEAHFRAVLAKDPEDAATWVLLGQVIDPNSDEALECHKKALALDPYLHAAKHAFGLAMRFRDEKQAEEILTDVDRLFSSNWYTPFKFPQYGEMGKYSEVIGTPTRSATKFQAAPVPHAAVVPVMADLAPGAIWLHTEGKGGDSRDGAIHRELRQRAGCTIVPLDYDGDGLTDLLLLSAVDVAGQPRDLLLHNEGNDHYRDVTSAAGLPAQASYAAAIADYDNDGKPDIVLTGLVGVRMLRNTGDGKFTDLTAAAGFDKLTGFFLGATWLDIDQDGDLDLVLSRYARHDPKQEGGVTLLLNIGEALPAPPGKPTPGLTTKFQAHPHAAFASLAKEPVAFTLALDADDDRDLDLLVSADSLAPVLIRNDRLLRFQRDETPVHPSLLPFVQSALTFDVDQDGRSDLLLLYQESAPLLARQRADASSGSRRFTPTPVNCSPLLQAHAVDWDLDGWPDVFALKRNGELLFLRNEGGVLNVLTSAVPTLDGRALALMPIVSPGKCEADLIVWTTNGLRRLNNSGNSNRSLRLQPSGKRDKVDLRTNADALGTWLFARANDLQSGAMVGGGSSGLGQSNLPPVLGLGKNQKASVVRLRWPDQVVQAELDVPTCEKVVIPETLRKGSSCPLLFTWDGSRWVYVTDFLGAGSMGETQPGGGYRPPRPEESVKIEAQQLSATDGEFRLRVGNPFDEVHYFDRLRLKVIDHPPATEVFPDERFPGAGPSPTQALYVLGQPIHPLLALDQRGRDITLSLRERDRRHAADYRKRSWLGYAEDHFIDLDFGDKLAWARATDPLALVLTGWVEYPYPESIYAATQAGLPTIAPTLERLDNAGKWQPLGEIGFPAGLTKTIMANLTGKVSGPSCRLRLRTNLQIGWDRVVVCPVGGIADRVTELDVKNATLGYAGYHREHYPVVGGPPEYDPDRRERVGSHGWAGKLTRFGDVTELLTERDDRFTIFGPGDEIDVRFPADKLPALPAGWRRSFVLHAIGYTKDTAPFSATGGQVEPLPFAAMSNYPYGKDERYPDDEKHRDYRRRYLTRDGTARPPR